MAKEEKVVPGSDACNQWYCNIRQGSFCCKECADKDICNTPCLNDPDKCGYYKDGQKEKFIELIQAAVDGCASYWAGKIADHLIANGATIQRWIDAEKDPPKNFVSVLGYMSDAEPFPPVRECYTVDGKFYFPALNEFHPVKKWTPMLNPPKEVVEK